MFAKEWMKFFLVCYLTVGAVSALEVGDSCYKNNRQLGKCKLIYQCADAIRDLKQGIPRSLCKEGGRVDVVCCFEEQGGRQIQQLRNSQRPKPNTSQARLAEQKCNEYSGLVFETVENPNWLRNQQARTKKVEKCGFKYHQMIVGGSNSEPKEFPHMALIGFGPVSNIKWLCAGSIISRRFILTAAHCYTSANPPTIVRIGELNYERTDDDAAPQDYRVSRTIIHPQYTFGETYNDIALIQLSQDMSFNEYARPACLNHHFASSEDRAVATGWGDQEFFSGEGSPTLREVGLYLFRFNECSAKFVPERGLRNGLDERQHLCAGSKLEKKDACEGDSGGPLQVYHPEYYCMYKILGVTSFGKGCASVIGTPGVYTRVANYIDWIENNAFAYG